MTLPRFRSGERAGVSIEVSGPRNAGAVASVALGLRANWRQFTLLVVVNFFVGAMVGLERSVLPVVATEEFRVASATAVLSFIATFGLAKAFANLASGWLADRRARRSTLLAGWIVALPVPLMILGARSWWWIVAANALLGVNQGLTWSTTVIMKIDLVGPKRRGLATGLNESAGYLAVAAASVLSGFMAAGYGLRAGAAYPGLAIAATGLLLSWFTKDTAHHVRLESSQTGAQPDDNRPSLAAMLRRSLWSDAGLFSVSQAGLVNNLNDGLAWGLFPLLFTRAGMDIREMSLLAAAYPATWGVLQLVTGPLSDRWGRKPPIVAGMIIQGAALVAIALAHGVVAWAMALVALGLGTALVYPTLLAAVGDISHPSWRGTTVGVYRLWRDLGYVAGALAAGILTDWLGAPMAIGAIGVLTAGSGLVAAVRFPRSSAHPENDGAAHAGTIVNVR